MIELKECALCYTMGTADDFVMANVTFAFDGANNGERRVCKDRETCNVRRAGRFGYVKPAPVARA